jgi:hypothetical protein
MTSEYTFTAWIEASDQWADAHRALREAREALKAAELAEIVASENLARHEHRPGVPRYLDTAQS